MDHSYAIAKTFHGHVETIGYSGPQTTDRSAGFDRDMPVSFTNATTNRNDRQRIGRVRIRIPHPGAIKHK